MLIGKSGSNIQRLRDQMPDIRVDVPVLDESKETFPIRLSGKKIDVDKARKLFDEHVEELQRSVDNTLEQMITIDPKWHGRFFLNNRRLIVDIQKQFGDITIRVPEKKSQSDQILLRGVKQTVERVQQYLLDLVDKWDNTITKQITVPQRHHGYLLAQGGSYIQPIQKEFNVMIKFPVKEKENKSDTIRITGRTDDVDKATIALEKMVPIETTLDIPFEVHGTLVGKGGSQLQSLIEQYPDVQITFPPMKSTSNLIRLKGQAEQVEAFEKTLLERYEKYQVDKQARAFEVHLNVKPEHRTLIFGNRRRPTMNLRQKHDVNIQVIDHQTPTSAVVPTPSINNDHHVEEGEIPDDQQAIPHEQPTSVPHEQQEIELIIRGYEVRALACRDEILKMIENFESKITMEIDIDHRIHARIIGGGGQKLQQIMKDYDVDIRFPPNNRSDQVHVIGVNQEKIDACIDHLLILEEDFLQDLPTKATGQNPLVAEIHTVQQEVPSARLKMNKGKKQAPFKVKNAPWTAEEQQNGHTLNRHDFDEFPTMNNGTDEHQDTPTTVNTIPISWGPSKRNK